MLSHPQTASQPTAAAVAPATTRPTLAEVKARAKAIKKARKHERQRFHFSWCACLHALGFSF